MVNLDNKFKKHYYYKTKILVFCNLFLLYKHIFLLLIKINQTMTFNINGVSRFLIYWISIAQVILSCKSDSKTPIPNVDHIRPDFKITRYEKELFTATNSNLIQDHFAFSKLYFEKILNLTDSIHPNSSLKMTNIQLFLTDTAVLKLYHLVEKKYGDFSIQENKLKKSLAYFKYYFPNKKEPHFYTFISEFGYGNFIFTDDDGSDGIGIGLDFFLGDDMDYKSLDPQNPAFSQYLTRSYNADHLVKKSWDSWIEDYLGNEPGQQFLDYMIHRGKSYYISKSIMPFEQDSVIFEYTQSQLDWCQKNEVEIWSFFLDSKLMYSVEHNKFNKYINPSPNSPGMPQQAPGRTACYIGYKIVDAYMLKSKKSIQELIDNKNSQEILDISHYKPRNKK